MFLAVTFMCLVSGDCQFFHDHSLTTQRECELRNEMVAKRMEADDNVSAYKMICIKIPEPINAGHTF
jgi:hypothetical protein